MLCFCGLSKCQIFCLYYWMVSRKVLCFCLDRKMRSSLDMVPTMSDLDSPQPRHGKVPIAPACTTVTSGTPSEDASRRKLKCQYCDKAFLKNFDLQQHLRSHTGEK